MKPNRYEATARGSVLVVVMIFCVIFGALAAAYLSAASTNIETARLQGESHRALVAAESGLAFVRTALPQCNLAGTSDAESTLEAIAADLNQRYGNTVFGGGQATVQDDGSVLLPPVTLSFPEGPSEFQIRVVAVDADNYRTECTGGASGCVRRSSASFAASGESWFLAAFGVASRSAIKMTGNPTIEGANDDSEGSILSTTFSDDVAIDLTGNVDISGDVSIVNPDGEVRIVGNCDIGGEVQIGVDEPAFPEVDTSPFEAYATNVVDGDTRTSGNCYFENIRIAAGTNPTFNGNTTIRGVVYIESPNRVRFSGNLDLVGCVVAEEPDGDLDLDSHYLHFTGNTSTNGVDALPGDAQFNGLRDLGGAFLLAPGYEVKFTGNFNTINGTLVASKFKFTGNAGGTIKGSLLNMNDTEFEMTGNSRLTIDHSDLNEDPTGLQFPRQLSYVAGSYCE